MRLVLDTFPRTFRLFKDTVQQSPLGLHTLLYGHCLKVQHAEA